ncbi:MAG: hypothetical protein Q8L78_09205 [Coxiellaceae bacterium]|nr:hypothetical protein [Coxiellaceae bacterium]
MPFVAIMPRISRSSCRTTKKREPQPKNGFLRDLEEARRLRVFSLSGSPTLFQHNAEVRTEEKKEEDFVGSENKNKEKKPEDYIEGFDVDVRFVVW